MRVVKLNKFNKVNNLYYEQFTSYDEYWRIVEQRERENAHDKNLNLKNITNDSSWCGVSSYDEAKNLLVNGWETNVEIIKN